MDKHAPPELWYRLQNLLDPLSKQYTQNHSLLEYSQNYLSRKQAYRYAGRYIRRFGWMTSSMGIWHTMSLQDTLQRKSAAKAAIQLMKKSLEDFEELLTVLDAKSAKQDG